MAHKYETLKIWMRELRVIQTISKSNFGFRVDQVEVILDGEKTEMAERPNDGYYYYYSGPNDEKTRGFCKQLLKVDKVFSEDDINTLSTLSGYDVFSYLPGPIMPKGGPGGPNCRHSWIRFRGKIVLTPPPTDRQINTVANKSIFN